MCIYRDKLKVVICLIDLGTGQRHTQRTVAIVLGGIAAFGFLVVCLLFAKSVMKRRGRKSEY